MYMKNLGVGEEGVVNSIISKKILGGGGGTPVGISFMSQCIASEAKI